MYIYIYTYTHTFPLCWDHVSDSLRSSSNEKPTASGNLYQILAMQMGGTTESTWSENQLHRKKGTKSRVSRKSQHFQYVWPRFRWFREYKTSLFGKSTLEKTHPFEDFQLMQLTFGMPPMAAFFPEVTAVAGLRELVRYNAQAHSAGHRGRVVGPRVWAVMCSRVMG